MKKILFSAIYLLILTLFSCSKDNIDETDIKYDEVKEKITNNLLEKRTNEDEYLTIECLSILYPISFVGENNTTYIINNEQDLEILLNSNNNIYDFKYPINGKLNGQNVVVDDLEELTEIISSCVPVNGWTLNDFPAYNIGGENSCFTLVYPLTIKNEQGTTFTINNEEELNIKICSELYFFVFPLTLKDKDNQNVVVNEIDELFNLLASCNDFIFIDSLNFGWDLDQFGCYTIKLPVTFNLENGNTVTVNTKEEFNLIFLNEGLAGFEYPITLVKEDGEELVINNDSQLKDAMQDCNTIIIDPEPEIDDSILLYLSSQDSSGLGPCFKIIYPISLAIVPLNDLPSFATINSDLEFQEVYNQAIAKNDALGLMYPVTLRRLKDNISVIINNKKELLDFIEECD